MAWIEVSGIVLGRAGTAWSACAVHASSEVIAETGESQMDNRQLGVSWEGSEGLRGATRNGGRLDSV